MRTRLVRLLVLAAVCCVFAQDVEGGIFRKRRCRRPCRPRACAPRCCDEPRGLRPAAALAMCPPGYICPLYKIADHGTYCSYRAHRCSGTYTNIDASCNLPLGGTCSACAAPCYSETRHGHTFHKNFDGVTRYPKEVQHIGAHIVGRPIYIKFNKRGREVYAILLHFFVTASADEKPGSDMDTFIGYEVRPSAVPNPHELRNYPAQLAPGKRHCFFVKVDGNQFQIVTLRR